MLVPVDKAADPVVIVGGSIAGLHAVQSLRHDGYDGDLIVTSEEHEVGYGRPPLSKSVLTGETHADTARLRTLGDALSIRQRLRERPRVIIACFGFIGCEVASSARQLGLDVTVVDSARHPLVQRFGPAIAREAYGSHRGQGVPLIFGVGIEHLTGQGKIEAVTLSD
ncbi:MAG: FAD-dependent oxidoreductase, partial [Nitrososphaerales archaeon]